MARQLTMQDFYKRARIIAISLVVLTAIEYLLPILIKRLDEYFSADFFISLLILWFYIMLRKLSTPNSRVRKASTIAIIGIIASVVLGVFFLLTIAITDSTSIHVLAITIAYIVPMVLSMIATFMIATLYPIKSVAFIGGIIYVILSFIQIILLIINSSNTVVGDSPNTIVIVVRTLANLGLATYIYGLTIKNN